MEALKEKYAPSAVPKKANEIVNISGKDVDEVGMDKIREQQAQLKELRVIVLDGLCIGSQATGSSELDVVLDVGETCPKCTELDLSQNLFESWEEILAIVKQLPALTSLRVDGNRLFFAGLAHGSVPLNSFSNLKSLHFSSCLLTWSEVSKAERSMQESIADASTDANNHWLFPVYHRAITGRQSAFRGNDAVVAGEAGNDQPRGERVHEPGLDSRSDQPTITPTHQSQA